MESLQAQLTHIAKHRHLKSPYRNAAFGDESILDSHISVIELGKLQGIDPDPWEI